VITGVHARTGKLLGIGDAETLYPRQPFLSEALEEQKAISARMQELRKLLYEYQIRNHVSGSDHASKVNNLKVRHADVSRRADLHQQALMGVLESSMTTDDNVVKLPSNS
jgi:hypothetical protein